MIPRPVRRYRDPVYPTRLEVLRRPGLLLRHQPPAWRQWPELAGALGLFLLADSSLSAAQPANAPAAIQKETSRPGGKEPAKAVAIVAPIFKHGEGRGSTGCIAMSPPVFLSEEEALQVIREEMKAAKMPLETASFELKGVSLSERPLKADLADAKSRIAAEFVDLQRYHELEWARAREQDPEGPSSFSTAQFYDFPEMAGYLTGRVERDASQPIRLGVFYDPLAGRLDYEKLREVEPGKVGPAQSLQDQELAARSLSKRLLRLQVQDFVKWLKAQGAI